MRRRSDTVKIDSMAVYSVEYISLGPVSTSMNGPVSLKEAIKQIQPFESVEIEALLTLIWAQDRIAQVAGQPLRDVDISSAQYNVLRILRGSPDGLRTREVVERMVTRAPNITRLVDKLEANGYLKRRRTSCDRRVIHLQITQPGLDLLEELALPMREATSRAMADLSTKKLQELTRLLNQIGGHAHALSCGAGSAQEQSKGA